MSGASKSEPQFFGVDERIFGRAQPGKRQAKAGRGKASEAIRLERKENSRHTAKNVGDTRLEKLTLVVIIVCFM